MIAAHVDWNHAPGCSSTCAIWNPATRWRSTGPTAVRRGSPCWRVEQYSKDTFPTERVYGDIDHAGLRLITCGGEFDRAARSYRDNVVVYASLVGSA